MLVVLGYICPNLVFKVLTTCQTLLGDSLNPVFSVVVVKSIIWCLYCDFR